MFQSIIKILFNRNMLLLLAPLMVYLLAGDKDIEALGLF